MKILFCTPCYGGQVTEQYFRSCLKLRDALFQSGVEHTWLTYRNESLITRARSRMVADFLETDATHMMFIDADIGFEPEDVGKVFALDADIGVGVYRMKKVGSEYAAWVDGELVSDLGKFDGPVNVDFAGTGFMMIRREVLTRMRKAYPELECPEDGFPALFDTEIEDGVYLSEDYAFCKRWRDLGGVVTMDPTVKLVHVGSMEFGH